jgi:hypothetical protein
MTLANMPSVAMTTGLSGDFACLSATDVANGGRRSQVMGHATGNRQNKIGIAPEPPTPGWAH